MKSLGIFAGGVLLVASSAPLANAAMQISYQIGAGAQTICASGGMGNANATGAICGSLPTFDFTDSGIEFQTLSASSNSPGSSVNANQEGSTVKIQNHNLTSETITIWLAAPDFTMPIAPPAVNYVSNLEVTNVTGTNTVGNMSCIDENNGLTPPTTAFCGNPAASLTNNDITLTGATTPQSDTVSENVAAITAPYSLEQKITITLAAGGQLNFITSQVLTSTPEPMGIALLGAVLMGASLIIRRKRKQEARVSGLV